MVISPLWYCIDSSFIFGPVCDSEPVSSAGLSPLLQAIRESDANANAKPACCRYFMCDGFGEGKAYNSKVAEKFSYPANFVAFRLLLDKLNPYSPGIALILQLVKACRQCTNIQLRDVLSHCRLMLKEQNAGGVVDMDHSIYGLFMPDR